MAVFSKTTATPVVPKSTTEKVAMAQESMDWALSSMRSTIESLSDAAADAQAAVDAAQAEMDQAALNKEAAQRVATDANSVAAKLSALMTP